MAVRLPSFDRLASTKAVAGLIKQHEKYLAHTPDETLAQHMALVSDYFLRILQNYGLEPIVDHLCLSVANKNERGASAVKKLFSDTVLYHDFGKVNENFQRVKMKNTRFLEEKHNGIESQHSILSAYLFLIHQYSNTEFCSVADSEKKLYMLPAIFAHNILRHHSAHLDDFSSGRTFQRFTSRLCTSLVNYLELFTVEADETLIAGLSNLQNLSLSDLSFEWFLLIRLNFSLLTAADYYATSHYYGNWNMLYSAFGTLSVEQKQQHYQNLKYSQPYNRILYEQNEHIRNIDLSELRIRSSDNLNKLRSKMAAEVLENIRRYAHDKLFYIEAPTGGGKTNLAFIATQELLQVNPELKKVYYVFPFTTLVTQIKKSAEDTFQLRTDEFVELHSRAPLKERRAEADQDGLYAENHVDEIDNQFVNYPYIFLTHVRFFDILTANDKSSIYLLHTLANSIVVIDEVQAYNPMLWDKMSFLLKKHAETLNIRFIIMSATLPKIGDLAEADFKYLLPNAISKFFTNPNFADRVTFDDTLAKLAPPKKEDRDAYIEALAYKVYEISETYRIVNGSARIIVEFIFKKSATQFAEVAKKLFPGYEVLVLSGTILEPRRREIINYLKSTDSLGKDVLLVSTQVVEAGIDLDMNLGFKNRSIVDSEEQLAGRVNRNAAKTGCTVYLFTLDDASLIYGADRRYREWKNGLEIDYLTILQTKRFDIIYDRIKEFLKKTNQGKNTGGTLTSYERHIADLNFPDVEKEFRLIEQKNISVFVPVSLPLNIKSGKTEEPLFTRRQIEFLTQQGIPIEDDHVSGAQVFDLYKKVITNREVPFSERKLSVLLLQSVMCLFTFSLFGESNLVKELESGGNSIEYGYLYLTTHEEVYDYSLGLLDDKLKNMIFL